MGLVSRVTIVTRGPPGITIAISGSYVRGLAVWIIRFRRFVQGF